jgi:hypothetical protein
LWFRFVHGNHLTQNSAVNILTERFTGGLENRGECRFSPGYGHGSHHGGMTGEITRERG